MKMLRLYSQEDIRCCPLDKWGILDPGTHRREEENKSEERADGRSFPFPLRRVIEDKDER